MKAAYLFETKLKWSKTLDAEFPFELNFNGKKLILRVNDFPEEPLFTLIIDNKEIVDFNAWPKNWEGEGGD